MPYFGPGIYEHYKGGHYRVLDLGQHESTGARLVIYNSYDLEHELQRCKNGVGFVLRPLNESDGDDAWNDKVRNPTGETGVHEFVPRFRKLNSV